MPPYPLAVTGATPTPLEREMHAELEASWEAHHASAADEVLAPEAQSRVAALRQEVRRLCAQAQLYLEENAAGVPAAVGCHGSSFRMEGLAGGAPSPSLLDFVKMSFQPHLPKAFIPFLTDESAARLQHGARRWLELCVLEDRLGRIAQLFELHEANPLQRAGYQALLIRVRKKKINHKKGKN